MGSTTRGKISTLKSKFDDSGNFSQEEMKLKPKEVKQLQLGLGFMMSEGVVLVGLDNSLKYKRCSLQNEINLEDAEDIMITITNNSNEIIDIREHKLLCHVKKLKF